MKRFLMPLVEFFGYCRSELEAMTRIMEIENKLAASSSYDFLFVFRPVAKELAEVTVHTYEHYLEEARLMFLEGKDAADVLWHYDLMLFNIYERRMKC